MPKNFECLQNENFGCITSKIDNCIDGKVPFVNCPEMGCNYKTGFGYSKICLCPVRKEIFKKYNQ